MNDFMKTILNAIQSWTKKEIKNSTSDWNQNDVNQPGYVKNRTHWDSRKEEKVNITFDGNIDGKEYLDFQGNGSIYFVKVSDLTPSINEIVGGEVSYIENGEVGTFEILEEHIEQESDTLYGFASGAIIVVLENTEENGMIITKGIWFLFIPNDNGYYSGLSYTITTGELKKIDEKYLPEIDISSKMDKNNPVGTGSFSMGRKSGTTIGNNSHAEGKNTTASGARTHAEGSNTHAEGNVSHAEGSNTHAEGVSSHAEGGFSHAEGPCAHAEGQYTHAEGYYSHAEGSYTHATGSAQHVQGAYNQIDPEYDANDQFKRNKYVHIVGNGTNDTARSNAHTLDWNGVGWFQGGLQVGGNAQDDGAKSVMLNGDKEIIIASSTEGSAKQFKITVDDTGTLTVSEI